MNNIERREKARLNALNYRRKYPEKVRAYKSRKIEKLRKCKIQLIKDKGGKCSMCGYCKEIKILQFHHLRDKKFALSELSRASSEIKLKEEAEKCILLCPNCHALTHLK